MKDTGLDENCMVPKVDSNCDCEEDNNCCREIKVDNQFNFHGPIFGKVTCTGDDCPEEW